MSAMAMIHPCALPPGALLGRYLASGAYADCYVTELAHPVTHAEFVEAFYTTAVFKLERLILRLAVSRPSTDAEAGQLARGERGGFAAWSVEERAPDQLLLCDLTGRTRSWLMVASPADRGIGVTSLYFGSAVVASRGPVFGALLGFHELYSRILLRAAAHRLSRNRAAR